MTELQWRLTSLLVQRHDGIASDVLFSATLRQGWHKGLHVCLDRCWVQIVGRTMNGYRIVEITRDGMMAWGDEYRRRKEAEREEGTA